MSGMIAFFSFGKNWIGTGRFRFVLRGPDHGHDLLPGRVNLFAGREQQAGMLAVQKHPESLAALRGADDLSGGIVQFFGVDVLYLCHGSKRLLKRVSVNWFFCERLRMFGTENRAVPCLVETGAAKLVVTNRWFCRVCPVLQAAKAEFVRVAEFTH